jgi:non-specific protein-tyrosine kinase
MDLLAYLAPIRKWWWLVLGAALLALLSSSVMLSQRSPSYQARAALMIGRTVFEPNPTAAELGLGERLADTYAVLAQRDPVKNAVKAALGLAELPEYETRSIPNAQLVEILVTDISAERAQAVANEIANQLIQLSPTGPSAVQEERQRFIGAQLDFLQQSIEDVQEDMVSQQEALARLTSAVEIARAQDALTAMQTKLDTLQSNYATLLPSSESGGVNFLTLIEPAELPWRPLGPSNFLLALLACLAGAVLGAGAAYLLEYMDTSLKTEAEVVRLLRLPIIGILGEISGSARGAARDGAPLIDSPFQPEMVEALRALWTNLEFASVDQPLRAILIASPSQNEGKTTVAVNLATTIALTGKKVALLDADMRYPGIHRALDLPLEPGLSDIFVGRSELGAAITPRHHGGLLVIPAGPPPPNPTELLGSRRMDQIISMIRGLADILIIDTPPFGLADAYVLASKVDGVIVIVRPGYTSRNRARAMQAQLEQAGATMLGTVLNRASWAHRKTPAGYGVASPGQGQGDSSLAGPETPLRARQIAPRSADRRRP